MAIPYNVFCTELYASKVHAMCNRVITLVVVIPYMNIHTFLHTWVTIR